MGTSNLKSTSITNYDTPSANTAGVGAPARIKCANDVVTAVSADDTSSTYKIARVPSNAKIKAVYIMSKIASAGSGDVNVAYSDSTTDGTQPSKAGNIPQISSANNKLFGAAQSLVLSGVRTDFTFKNSFLAKHQNMPLWQVLTDLGCTEFSADPGGFFDIQINITTAVTTGGVVTCEVWYE